MLKHIQTALMLLIAQVWAPTYQVNFSDRQESVEIVRPRYSWRRANVQNLIDAIRNQSRTSSDGTGQATKVTIYRSSNGSLAELPVDTSLVEGETYTCLFSRDIKAELLEQLRTRASQELQVMSTNHQTLLESCNQLLVQTSQLHRPHFCKRLQYHLGWGSAEEQERRELISLLDCTRRELQYSTYIIQELQQFLTNTRTPIALDWEFRQTREVTLPLSDYPALSFNNIDIKRDGVLVCTIKFDGGACRLYRFSSYFLQDPTLVLLCRDVANLLIR